jgi:hypothetical protein
LSPIRKPGDVIYVDTELHVWHGVDDFRGGKATVSTVEIQGSAGNESAWIQRQAKLEAEYGEG